LLCNVFLGKRTASSSNSLLFSIFVLNYQLIKNYNFREKTNTLVMKEREDLYQKTYKGNVKILRGHRASYRQLGAKNLKASARTHARNYNF